jgi:hypothetical protein
MGRTIASIVGGRRACLPNHNLTSMEKMKMNSIKRLAVCAAGIAALACVGCGSSTKEVDSTTYVPAPAPAQIVVQAPPVQVIPPTTTTSTSMDKSSNSTNSSNGGTVDSSSSHHSESTTVTPSN